VADYYTTVRIMAYTAHANRRQVMPGGHIDWQLVMRDLQEGFRLTKGCKRVLIITFKRIADALQTTHKHLINHHHTAAIHYEKAVGMNAWEDWDAIVSMYDARTPPLVLPNNELDWSQSSGNARRMATQGHGRTRDAQPRTCPAMHVVIGKEPPEDWGNDNCLVAFRPIGRPPGLMPDDVMGALVELRQQLGMRAAAKQLGVPYSTLAAWLTGANKPSADKLETLRKLLPGPGARV
jgi:hypothetical protein